jgi:hypothetical protein
LVDTSPCGVRVTSVNGIAAVREIRRDPHLQRFSRVIVAANDENTNVLHS